MGIGAKHGENIMVDEQLSTAFRVEDRKYLDSFRYRPCEACDAQDGTVVPAHIRTGNEGGTALKPSDDLVVALCFSCHAEQERNIGANWWFEKVFKRIIRKRYADWIDRNHHTSEGGILE
jgi:hypothetical protein